MSGQVEITSNGTGPKTKSRNRFAEKEVATIVRRPREAAACDENVEMPEVQKIKVNIPALKTQILKLTIVGDSILVTNCWSERTIQKIIDTQTKQAKTAKEARNPHLDYVESLFWISEKPCNEPSQKQIEKATLGFPARLIKKAAVDACRYVDGMKMTQTWGAFFVLPDPEHGSYVRIKGTPVMRQDMVRNANGNADVRFRGEFRKWSMDLAIRYNKNVISPEQVVNLFQTAGFSVGIGEYRAQRGGDWGAFHVEGV